MEFDNRCCRCRKKIPRGKELGGRYGGVVCRNNRSCVRCWFRTDHGYGQRRYEADDTKSIPLVDRPRGGLTDRNGTPAAECYGCNDNLPYHIDVRERIREQERIERELRENGFIEISDSD